MLSNDTRQAILAFRAERDWAQFHTVRTLASALVVEAAELLEIVQWTADDGLASRVAERRAEVEAEVADVAILLAYLVNDLGLDLDAVVRAKLARNAAKYPVEQARGTSRKYTELGPTGAGRDDR
ncbi:MAG: nucleotide pyrophosphohydrolase [Chromatiales bacterium]|nr:nucleotide pyrophosphohydrolase [Chromatiales bacterium]